MIKRNIIDGAGRKYKKMKNEAIVRIVCVGE